MTACPLRASRATGILQGQVQDARVTGRFEAARTSAAASAASAAEAGSDHSPLQPTGASPQLRTGVHWSRPNDGLAPWLHVHYPGVIGENFENPIGLEAALLPPRHVPTWSQASPLAVADYNHSAALL